MDTYVNALLKRTKCIPIINMNAGVSHNCYTVLLKLLLAGGSKRNQILVDALVY